MKRMNKPSFPFPKGLFFLFCLILPGVANAQTAKKDTALNRTVIVEQEYNPDIMDASKINILPKLKEPTVEKKGIEYSTNMIPFTAFRNNPAIPPYAKALPQADAQRGYIRLGYGNYGNVDGKFSYLLDLSKKDRIGVTAGIDGMNGRFGYLDNEKIKLRYYRSAAHINYLHRFNKADFNLAGNWGLSNFNFVPDALISHQRFTSSDFHIGTNSTDETLPIQFKAETNLMFYSRAHNAAYNKEKKRYSSLGLDETRLLTKADASSPINDRKKVGIALQMDNFFYKKGYRGNYTSLQLNPYYELNNEDWKLRLGANVDLSFSSDQALQASPDIDVQYVFSDSYLFYAQASGGRTLNDFRRIEQFCPYAEILQNPVTDNTYEQKGELGFKASPYAGIRFRLFGGYQKLIDDIYQASENWIPGPVSVIDIKQENTSNTYIGIHYSHEYKDYFRLSAEAVYRHWNASQTALLFKPAFSLDIQTDIRPAPELLINLGCQYTTREKAGSEKRNPINNLYAGATYNMHKNLSAYIKFSNILNRKYQYYDWYPTEGFNFLGGVSFNF